MIKNVSLKGRDLINLMVERSITEGKEKMREERKYGDNYRRIDNTENENGKI